MRITKTMPRDFYDFVTDIVKKTTVVIIAIIALIAVAVKFSSDTTSEARADDFQLVVGESYIFDGFSEFCYKKKHLDAILDVLSFFGKEVYELFFQTYAYGIDPETGESRCGILWGEHILRVEAFWPAGERYLNGKMLRVTVVLFSNPSLPQNIWYNQHYSYTALEVIPASRLEERVEQETIRHRARARASSRTAHGYLFAY